MQKDVKEIALSLLEQLRKDNIFVYLGIEIEFYLRQEGRAPDDGAILEFSSLISDVVLEKERGNGQYEFAIAYKEASDAVLVLEDLRSRIALAANQCEMEAIFKPKPFVDDYGSAMHLHLSLHRGDQSNIFAEDDEMMQRVILSILDLVKSDLDFICNDDDLIRLQPGWMAPSHLAWGGNNRSVVIRIPHDISAHKRFEFRLPSADADIYKVLLFLLMGVVLRGAQRIYHPKIYGNAHDPQYDLPRLEFCNNILQKRFVDLPTLAQSLKKFSNYRITNDE